MAKIEQAVRWFENIADECDRLTSGNVAHLGCQIKGMALRSAEYLKKHGKEIAFKVGDRIRIKGSCAKGDVIKNIYFDGRGLMFEFEGNSDDSPVDRDWELVNEQVMHVSNHLFDECVSNVPDWVMKETSDKMDAMIAEEDLEKAANDYGKEQYGKKANLLPDRCMACYAPIVHAYKNGAQWDRRQLAKNAIPCEVEYYDGPILNYTQKQLDDALSRIGAKVGDEVDIVILPRSKK